MNVERVSARKQEVFLMESNKVNQLESAKVYHNHQEMKKRNSKFRLRTNHVSKFEFLLGC